MEEGSENEAKLIPIVASEIMEMIQKGKPVKLDHVKVSGLLDAFKCKTISSSIEITNSIFDANIYFMNCQFQEPVDFSGTTFNGKAEFSGAVFSEGALFATKTNFSSATFNNDALFSTAKFNNEGDFSDATFNVVANFSSAIFNRATFDRATFNGAVHFIGTGPFNEYASFNGAIFNGCTNFSICQFSGNATFDGSRFGKNATFDGSQFHRSIDFSESRFSGDVLTFKDAKFKDAKSQEDACRRAKNLLEKNGDREEAGYHFYREMDGKRRQKPWYIRYPEFIFIQMIFGYGVHPFRLWACWIGFVILFAIIYSLGHGIDATASQLKGNTTTTIDYIWFSIATAVTPGYAGYKPATDFKLVAGLEAIFGTFMWAAFIATFARKYMR